MLAMNGINGNVHEVINNNLYLHSFSLCREIKTSPYYVILGGDSDEKT